MAIPSAMAITSAKKLVAIPSATITLYQLSHMWCSICHMVKISAYYDMAITSAIMAITSAKYM